MREDTPWERRGELGFLQGLWLTWKSSLFAPEKFWATVKPDGKWTDALLYGWIMTALALPLNLLNVWLQRFQLEQTMQQAQKMPEQFQKFVEMFTGKTGMAMMVGSVLVYPLFIIIYGAILHLFCMVWGAGKNGMWATVRVLAYAAGPAALQGVPCVGAAAAIYSLILMGWGIYRVQETTVGRAVGVLVSVFLVVCCCACGAVALLVGSVAGTMPR